MGPNAPNFFTDDNSDFVMSPYKVAKEGQSHSLLHVSANSNANKCPKAVTSRLTEATLVPREGYAVAQLIEALRYKSEGRGFD